MASEERESQRLGANQCEVTQGSMYRFRSTRALLGEFQELDKQEVYFASCNELNDPMEGFKDVLWRGDLILWTNLLNHYLVCLMDTVIAAYISGPEHNFADNDNFVLHTPTSFATPQLRDLYQQIRDGFFRHQDAALLPTLLSERISPVRRNELLFCLRFVHFHALNSVLTALEDHDLMPVRPPQDTFRAASAKPIALRQMFEALRASELEHPDHPEFAEVMSTICNQQSAQLAIINEYNGLLSSIGRAWQTVISDFPERYVIQLDKLLYSDWYAACFISDPDHAAMWGHYGDGHKGVCLKFRTHINASGMPSITLLETDEWAGRQNIANPKAVAHQLYKVNYQERFVEIDFFRSIGRFSKPELEHWYKDSAGNLSSCAQDVFSDPDRWRKKYWENFYITATTKLPDWAPENEYRIILHSLMQDLSGMSSRKLKYNFGDLQGIVFGIKTSSADKLAILRMIEVKCHAEGRKNFEFYQAYYSHKTGKIENVRLGLLKFD